MPRALASRFARITPKVARSFSKEESAGWVIPAISASFGCEIFRSVRARKMALPGEIRSRFDMPWIVC